MSVREAWVTIIKIDFYSFYIFPHLESTAKESTYVRRSVTIINSFLSYFMLVVGEMSLSVLHCGLTEK